MNKSCPAAQDLTKFVQGDLPSSQTDSVSEHLGNCPDCQQTIHQLESNDTFVMQLKAAGAASQEAAIELEAGCRESVCKLQSLPPGSVSRSGGGGSDSLSSPSLGGAAKGAPCSREAFLESLFASGAIGPERWKEIEGSLPAVARGGEAQPLAKALVERGVITRFQAQAIYQGKGKALRYGSYVVQERLGAGGMGQVFKARHLKMDRLVALKVLSRAAKGSPDAAQRFLREVKAAARLVHPNIVTAYDASEQEGAFYLVMEYVSGVDLAQVVKKRGGLPLPEALGYILQAARGLAYAHEQGVVHRDIKPANLLLADDGTVKILDMGLARIDHEAGSVAAVQEGLTQTGQVMGTVDYMAPEQALDTRRADARSDIYSLGCTFYRLLTGENVFGGETMVEKLLAHREDEIPRLSLKCSGGYDELDRVFWRMLAKRPEDRFATMHELIAELEWISSTHQNRFEQAPDSIENLLSPEVRRPVGLHQGPRPAFQLASQRRTKLPWLIAGGVGLAALLLAGVILFLRGDGKTAVRIQIDDPAITVSFDDEGAVFTGVDDQHEIRVVPGTHRMTIKRNGFEFDTDTFEIKKGEDIALRVETVPGRVQVIDLASGSVVSEKELRAVPPRATASLTPAVVVPAVVAPAVATPVEPPQVATTIPPTTPPVDSAVTSTVMPNTALPPQAPPIEGLVATRILAKGKPTGLAPGVVAFGAPPGDGRRGANGVVTMAPKNWTEQGTEWRYTYTRSRSAWGGQIVHPWKQGHLVIGMQRDIHISPGGSWAKLGWYTKANQLPVSRTAAYPKWIPFKDSVTQEIVSRLDANGRYTMYVGGELVAETTVTDAEPLILEVFEPPAGSGKTVTGFVGEGMPRTLSPGEAAVIVGPQDSGQNTLQNIVLTVAQ